MLFHAFIVRVTHSVFDENCTADRVTETDFIVAQKSFFSLLFPTPEYPL
jgi:hypothetical protein